MIYGKEEINKKNNKLKQTYSSEYSEILYAKRNA